MQYHLEEMMMLTHLPDNCVIHVYKARVRARPLAADTYISMIDVTYKIFDLGESSP